MKTLLTMTGAVALSLGTAGMAHADCGDVSLAEMNWPSAAVVAQVSKFIMEQGYGCNVTIVPTSTTPALVSIAENGTPDIAQELWVNGVSAYGQLQEEGKLVEVADTLSDGGVEGWWLPKYLVDAHPELATIEGVVANKDLVGGRFHQCPEGWGCKNGNDELTRNFGLVDAGFEIFQHGSGETLATSIASAYENQEPWFGYYWAPTSVLGKYPMVNVDLGAYDAEVFTCAADIDCDTTGKSSWPVAPVKSAVTTVFGEREPEAAELIKHVEFTNAQMGEVLAWAENNSASNEEAAVYFITNYSDVWSEWVNDAAKEKLAVLIK